jgi:hypothetical protein
MSQRAVSRISEIEVFLHAFFTTDLLFLYANISLFERARRRCKFMFLMFWKIEEILALRILVRLEN